MSEQIDLWNDTTHREELVLSLRAEWFQLICAGTKRYEYRRAYRTDATLAYVYVNAPVAAVCGRLELDPPVVGSPTEIARIAEAQRPGNGASVLRYLGARERGYAVPIVRAETCRPVGLGQLRAVEPRFMPPQSYLLLRNYPALRALLQNAFGS